MKNSRVELTVGLVGNELLVTEKVTSSLCLLGESHNIRGRCQVPVGVAPELASGTEAGLDLVHNHSHSVLLGQVPQALEEGR